MTYQGLSFFKYSNNLIRNHLQCLLSEKRFQHVLRVLNTAEKIANLLTWDHTQKNRLEQAVLFHDYAKGMSAEQLMEYAHIHHIDLGDSAAPIFHAIVGAWMAEHFFAIRDKDILQAVLYHTTGHPELLGNPIGAVLFLADFLEPGRGKDNSHIWREIPDNITNALYLVVKEKIIHVIQKNQPISNESISFYNFLLNAVPK